MALQPLEINYAPSQVGKMMYFRKSTLRTCYPKNPHYDLNIRPTAKKFSKHIAYEPLCIKSYHAPKPPRKKYTPSQVLSILPQLPPLRP